MQHAFCDKKIASVITSPTACCGQSLPIIYQLTRKISCSKIIRFGKPSLRQVVTEPDIRFNMAHSEDMIVVVVTCRASVGVDVEFIRELQDAHQIVTHNFSPEEQRYLTGGPEQETEGSFFHLLDTERSLR